MKYFPVLAFSFLIYAGFRSNEIAGFPLGKFDFSLFPCKCIA